MARFVSAQTVKVDPDISKLPGGQVLQDFTDGLAAFALAACVVGFLVGAVVWALGSHSNNHNYAVAGRRATLACAGIALLIGGADAIVNFFYGAGRGI